MIRKATLSDKSVLCDLFSKTLHTHASYISHGEMQMGIATDDGTLATDFIEKWSKYIENHINDTHFSNVLIYEEDEIVLGFLLGTKEEDGSDYYGIINDVCVNSEVRKSGIGAKLMTAIFDWFKSEGIKAVYLESGLENHDAHHFFEKKGFKAVSKVFKMTI
ncbi:MAG: GNAT family N-acetyltransferase [Rikenellaceae bacterium]